jgi:hypothetical protein
VNDSWRNVLLDCRDKHNIVRELQHPRRFVLEFEFVEQKLCVCFGSTVSIITLNNKFIRFILAPCDQFSVLNMYFYSLCCLQRDLFYSCWPLRRRSAYSYCCTYYGQQVKQMTKCTSHSEKTKHDSRVSKKSRSKRRNLL